MFADFNYYKENFGGTKIATKEEYNYLARQGCKYIEKYTVEVNENTQDCECAISEYLQSSLKQGNMTSENIPNYYSVSWGANDNNARLSEINAILCLYLGNLYSSVGIVKLIG